MKTIKLIYKLGIVLLLSGCLNIACELKWKPEAYLDQESKDYCLYAKGSYWIYQDSVSHSLDSITINNVDYEFRSRGEGGHKYENFDFEDVEIIKGGKTKIDLKNKKIVLNESNLELLLQTFTTIYKKNKAEVDYVLKVNLHALFPETIPQPDKTYIPNALASSLSTWGNSIDEFSDDDKNAIKTFCKL